MESDGWLEIRFPKSGFEETDEWKKTKFNQIYFDDNWINTYNKVISQTRIRKTNWNLIGKTVILLRRNLTEQEFNIWANFCWPFVGYNNKLWNVTDGK